MSSIRDQQANLVMTPDRDEMVDPPKLKRSLKEGSIRKRSKLKKRKIVKPIPFVPATQALDLVDDESSDSSLGDTDDAEVDDILATVAHPDATLTEKDKVERKLKELIRWHGESLLDNLMNYMDEVFIDTETESEEEEERDDGIDMEH